MPGLSLSLGLGLSPRSGGSANTPPDFYVDSVNPIIELSSSDTMTGANAIENRRAAMPVDANIYTHSSGDISAPGFAVSAAVATRRYANGPAGNLTAMRCQITPAGGLAYVALTNSQTLPLGTYTVGIKIKSNAGAGNQTVKFGDFNVGVGSMTVCNVTEAGYTKHTQTFTISGSPRAIFLLLLREAADAAVDILVDEVQVYSGSSVPEYNTEVPDGHMVPFYRNGTNIVVTGGLVDNTATKKPGIVKLGTFPVAKSFAQGTLMAAIETADTSGTYGKILGLSGVTGSWDIGVSSGNAYAAPVVLPNAAQNLFNSGQRVVGKGPAVLACTFNGSKRAFYLNGVLLIETTTSTGPFSGQAFGFMGDPLNISGNSVGAFPFLGKVSDALVFDQVLDDDQILQATEVLRAAHLAASGNPSTPKNFYLAEGDSITQGFGSALNTYYKRFFDTFPANWFGFNSATAGARLLTGGANEDLSERLPLTLRRIETGIAAGHNVVVSVLIGANLIPSSADLFAYYDTLRAAGAKLIACTITPNNSSSFPTFETDRLALNTEIRNATTRWDALCDFGADPDIGVRTVTTANAAPNANYQDYVHLNDTGYAFAATLMNAALASLAVY